MWRSASSVPRASASAHRPACAHRRQQTRLPTHPSHTVLNNPAHRTDYPQGLLTNISSFIAQVSQTPKAYHGADPLPPRHRQEDRQGAFQQAVEQERGYSGTFDSMSRGGHGRLMRDADIFELYAVYARVRTYDVIPPRYDAMRCDALHYFRSASHHDTLRRRSDILKGQRARECICAGDGWI